MSAEALECKTRGNEALKAGKYNDAIKHYSEAIEKDPTGHVFFSNRASCYLTLAAAAAKLGTTGPERSEAALCQKALADAQQCISLKADFWKGHSHAANALCRLGRFNEAVACVTAGLTSCPDSTQLQNRLEEVQKVQTENSLGYRIWGSKSKRDRLSRLPLRFAIVLAAVVYLTPALPGGPTPFSNPWAKMAYRQVMIMSLFNIVWHLLATYGRPRMAKDYAAYIIKDPNSQKLFLCALCMNARPCVLALFPVIGHDLKDVLLFLYQLTGVGSGLFGACVLPLVGSPAWPRLSEAQKKYVFDHALNGAMALTEVLMGIVLLAEMATPLRAMLPTVFFWQFLRIRYMIDETYSQKAFGTVNGWISGLLPGPIKTGYDKAAGFLHSMGKLPEPGEKPSMLGNCTVM